MRFVDLSIAIENNEHSDPPGFSPKVSYTDHAAGAQQLIASFPGLTPQDLPDGEGWAVEISWFPAQARQPSHRPVRG